MQIAARRLLDLSVSLRPLPSKTAEALPIEQVAQVDVKATREAYEGVSNTSLEASALSTARLDFGVLSSSDFEALKTEFGGRSQVPYESGRSYEAVDFLPPALQALHGRDLETPEPAVIPDSASWWQLPVGADKLVDLTANCHGTAWEAAQAYRGQPGLDIFYADASRMDGLLADKATFELVPAGVANQKLVPDVLQPGDLVAFYRDGGAEDLLHTAVYAGGGLLFEKPNTEGHQGADAPYRLSTPDMARRPVEHFLGGSALQLKVFRALGPLPEPEEAFTSEVEGLSSWEKSHGPLGMPLLSQLELSLGGGVRGEYLTTLVEQPVVLDASGRGVPAP